MWFAIRQGTVSKQFYVFISLIEEDGKMKGSSDIIL